MKTKRSLLVGITVLLLASVALPESGLGQRKGPPPWAPAHGYRAKMRQVYFPQYNFYYDTYRGIYIYMGGNGWQFSVQLPVQYEDVDLDACAQFPLYIDSDTPQIYNRDHRGRYAAWSGGYEGKQHHGKWKKKKH